MYKCLFEKSDLDDLTVSALQHLCTAILPMLQRQLCDQLPGGTLFVQNAEHSPAKNKYFKWPPKNDVQTVYTEMPCQN